MIKSYIKKLENEIEELVTRYKADYIPDSVGYSNFNLHIALLELKIKILKALINETA